MSQSSKSSRSSTENPEVAGIPEGGLDSSQFNMTSLEKLDVWDLADLAQEIFLDLATEIFGDLADLAK